MKQIDDALNRLKPYLTDIVESEYKKDPPDYRSDEDYGYFNGGSSLPIARLRLDWEIADDVVSKATDERVVELMLEAMKVDLEDLVINGDMDNIEDPLLKTIDGAKKRGKEVKDVDIFSSVAYKEVKERKNSTEYTVFILMAIDFK